MHEEEQQLLFDFDKPEEVKKSPHKKEELKAAIIRRAVLAWLASQDPTGIGIRVPVRFSNFKADVAAFWSDKKGNKYFIPSKTLLCVVRHKNTKSFAECYQNEKLIMELNKLRRRKADIEAEIRRTEPELRDRNNLFDEFDTWNYEATTNSEYKECCYNIEKMEHTIYHGTIFERIRSANVANYMYIAVPCDTLHEYDIAEGWGLLYVYPDFNVRIIKEAQFFPCRIERHYHLIQQIAASAMNQVLFSQGIRLLSDNTPVFTPLPHRRRRTNKRHDANYKTN